MNTLNSKNQEFLTSLSLSESQKDKIIKHPDQFDIYSYLEPIYFLRKNGFVEDHPFIRNLVQSLEPYYS